MATTPTEAVESILTNGYARVRLDERGAGELRNALDRATEYFAKPIADKQANRSADDNYGYRPMGVEYSITPDRPDINEVFTLWSDRTDLIPHSDDIPEMVDGLRGWRDRLAPFLREVFVQLAAHFGKGEAPEFHASSYLQINSYLTVGEERELLQERHEDGHLVTVIHATKPGLEIFPGGGDEPASTEFAVDEVIIMPGSVLTDMTLDACGPLFHQVRNLGLVGRQSIMYFVNPELEKPLHPWVGTEEERMATDLRDAVRAKPSMFGLPETPEL